MSDEQKPFELETVAIEDLKPHPRNYQEHPDDQLEHIMQSIRDNGLYRNVVVARDDTILAGHGVVLAMKRLGRESIPVYRLDLDPDDPRALKVLAGDNEQRHLAERDDRALTELLAEVNDAVGLEGTGFDEMMLANLVFVTRPASEIADFDAAAHWVGMPEYEGQMPLKLVVNFRDGTDRDEFMRLIDASIINMKRGETWSVWWPAKETEDPTSLIFEDDDGERK